MDKVDRVLHGGLGGGEYQIVLRICHNWLLCKSKIRRFSVSLIDGDGILRPCHRGEHERQENGCQFGFHIISCFCLMPGISVFVIEGVYYTRFHWRN